MGIKKDWMYVSVYNSMQCADDQQFGDSMFKGYDYARTLSKPEFLEIMSDTCVYVVIRDRAVSVDMSTDDYLDIILEDDDNRREL